jgi:hypothetical protein
MLLVPGNPLNPRRVDPHFAAEADAARALGVPVALIDLGAQEHPEDMVTAVPAGDDAVYRGLPMTVGEYTAFAKVLDARRVTLRTSPDDYRMAQDRTRWPEALRAVVLDSEAGPPLRTWWIGGRCLLKPPELDLVEIEPVITDLALPFVSADLVRRTDGAWRIVALTDGQVSEWPASRDPADLMAGLF